MPLSPDEIRALQAKAKELRCLMIDVTVWSGGAHIGGSLSAADLLTALYYKYLRVRPEEPDWPDRDRFVLSKGHGGVGLASVLADRGYFPKELLHEFNHFKSPFGMHLDGAKVPGVDASTGSLGHGLSMAVGMALGARFQGKGWLTYCLLGDGECNEGSVWEAFMAAGHYRLDNLVFVIDYNKVQAKGFLSQDMGIEPIADKLRAFQLDVHEIRNGHNVSEIIDLFTVLRQQRRGKPIGIVLHTVKGKKVAECQCNPNWHTSAPRNPDAAGAWLRELWEQDGRRLGIPKSFPDALHQAIRVLPPLHSNPDPVTDRQA